jgi:hypothetical protein
VYAWRLCYLAPPRQVWRGVPRGIRSLGRHPAADPRPPGAPPAGPWQEPNWVRLSLTRCDHQTKCDQQVSAFDLTRPRALRWLVARNTPNSLPAIGHRADCERQAFTECHVGRRASAGSACSKAQVLNPDVHMAISLAACSASIRQLQPTRVQSFYL